MFALNECVVWVRLRGIPYERLPYSRGTVIKVRGKGILRGHRLHVLRPHDGDDGFLSNGVVNKSRADQVKRVAVSNLVRYTLRNRSRHQIRPFLLTANQLNGLFFLGVRIVE